MSNTIKLKRGSGSDPSASDLVVGEIAVRTDTGKLFTKKDDNSVAEISGSGGGITSDAQNNTVGGTNAGNSFSGTDATNNTLFGYNAGTDLTTADGITALGSEAAANVTSGQKTTAIGFEACKATKDSHSNTGIGYQALKSADNAGGEYTFLGSLCTAVGANALDALTTGRECTAIGVNAMGAATTIYQTVAIGNGALEQATSSAHENVAIGYEAGKGCTGSKNIFIGMRSAFVQSISGTNNIIIGTNAQASSTSVNNEVTIGTTGFYGVDKFRIPGLNFILKGNSSIPTERHVLTVDSNGEANFAEASGGGPTGGGSDKVFTENGQTVTTNYTIGDTFGAACNAMAAGPIAINSGITVTIDSGDTLTIV